MSTVKIWLTKYCDTMLYSSIFHMSSRLHDMERKARKTGDEKKEEITFVQQSWCRQHDAIERKEISFIFHCSGCMFYRQVIRFCFWHHILNWQIKENRIYKTQGKNTRTHNTMWNWMEIENPWFFGPLFPVASKHIALSRNHPSIRTLNIMTCYPMRLSLNLTIYIIIWEKQYFITKQRTHTDNRNTHPHKSKLTITPPQLIQFRNTE